MARRVLGDAPRSISMDVRMARETRPARPRDVNCLATLRAAQATPAACQPFFNRRSRVKSQATARDSAQWLQSAVSARISRSSSASVCSGDGVNRSRSVPFGTVG